jgi:hypothetical protein
MEELEYSFRSTMAQPFRPGLVRKYLVDQAGLSVEEALKLLKG